MYMKRNLSLVRNLLLGIEKLIDELKTSCSSKDMEALLYDYTHQDIVSHLRLLQRAGFIDADIRSWVDGSFDMTIRGLTITGFEYLDAVRDDSIWQTIEEGLSQQEGYVALDAVKEAALQIATTTLLSA